MPRRGSHRCAGSRNVDTGVCVMQCPDNFYPFSVRDLGENGRELRMDIAQVHDVGAEVVQQFGEFALDLSRAEWPEEGFHIFNPGVNFISLGK